MNSELIGQAVNSCVLGNFILQGYDVHSFITINLRGQWCHMNHSGEGRKLEKSDLSLITTEYEEAK